MPFYKTYDPAPSMKGLIRDYQVYHINWNEGGILPNPFITCLANTEQNLYFLIHSPMKIVPNSNVEIPVPPVVVTGPKSKPVGLLFGKNHLMVKVAFQPTGTYRLLGINMNKTVNNGVDAKTIWGDDVINLLNQLRESPSYDSMVEMVNSFIDAKYDRNCRPEEPIDKVAVEMLNPLNNNSMQEWASDACLSLRQFERSFIERVGISPKLFTRIVRFEHAMLIKNQCANKSWSDIVQECGYTDSSHLLKEFKQFAEFPPSQFYATQTSGFSQLSTG